MLLLSVAVMAAGRRPLIRAPRDAAVTGGYMVVLEEKLSADEFRQLVARISRISGGSSVHSYVENVAKVVTVSLSPYALEMVRSFAPAMRACMALHAWLALCLAS